jgi:putative DNA primase/helicase
VTGRVPSFAGLSPGSLPGDPLPGDPWTELGYAQRLVKVYGDRLRYVAAWTQWLVWDGKRWARDETGQAARWAKLTARAMTDLVLDSDDPVFVRDHAVIARKAETSAAVTSILKLASTEDGIAISHTDLDADPFLLNCANGTLDLRTGEMHQHDPADLLTKMTRAAYDPDAPCPEFTGFLEKVQTDKEMRAYLARLLGHALEGRVTEHVLPIFYGTGKNGKSTLTGAIVYALGDYADTADSDLLNARSFDAHPTGVADLFGLRLARIDEGDKGRHLGEGTVKRLTGGDRLKARRMRENFWSFEPSHTFLMLTNHKPVITGTDEGIWRRVRLVPWNVVIPEPEQDRKLGDRLVLEADAILAWLVAGHRDWAECGLREPEAVLTATEDYRGESDALGRFLAECCMEHGEIKSSQLFGTWQKWCAQESEDPGTQTAFSNELTNRGYDKQPKSTGNFWQSLSLAGPVHLVEG